MAARGHMTWAPEGRGGGRDDLERKAVNKGSSSIGEVGWANVWKTQGVAVGSLTNIYSLVGTHAFFVLSC